MATRTFAYGGVDYKWSTVGNWNVAVPVSGDDVVIPTGQTVEFDVDQSGFAVGLASLVLNGELYASIAAGSYYLKMAGHITATVTGGILRAGSSGARYPSTCLFTIYFNGNYQINCNVSNYINIQFWCYQPTAQYARLISATAKTITSVTTGITTTIGCVAHGYNVGDTVFLANVGGIPGLSNRIFKVGTKVADSFTINYPDPNIAVNSTGFGIYTSGGLVCPSQAEAAGQTQIEIDTDLSADAEWTRAGAMVRIDNINRTLQSEIFSLSGVAAGWLTLAAGLAATKLSGSLAILVARNIRINSSAVAISNGMIRYGIGHQLDAEIRPGSGSTNGVQDAGNSTYFCGVISGCSQGVYFGSGHSFGGGVISGCSQGVYFGSGYFQKPGITLSNNTQDMYGLCVFSGYGASLNSTIQVAAYNNNVEGLNPPNGRDQIIIRDIGGVPGALKAWMYAGRIIDRSGIEPNFTIGTTRKFIFENLTTPVFLDRVVYAEIGKPITVNFSIQKDANGMTETPQSQIFDQSDDPFDGYAAGATQIMTDNLLQQDYTLTYTALRSGNHVVRVRGKNASGNLWVAMQILVGSIIVVED
jgi:hypothetical protein